MVKKTTLFKNTVIILICLAFFLGTNYFAFALKNGSDGSLNLKSNNSYNADYKQNKSSLTKQNILKTDTISKAASQFIYIGEQAHNSEYINNLLVENYGSPVLLMEKEQAINTLKKEKRKAFLIIIGLSLLMAIALFSLIRLYKNQRLYKARFDKLLSVQNKKTNVSSNKISGLSSELVAETLRQLTGFENNRGYLNNVLTLHSLSKSFNTNSNYLSKIINCLKKKNFSSYISDLRIDYCIEELKTNRMFRKYAVKAIALEIGFNNAESFSKAFYKRTGIYPSYFIRELEKR